MKWSVSANTTDDSIMSLIQNSNKDVMEENSNKNAYIASTQRDLIAGEVSKDLTKRVLLPEKIVKAHEDGVLHFHDMDYFLQSIFNCCLINIGDMLEQWNGDEWQADRESEEFSGGLYGHDADHFSSCEQPIWRTICRCAVIWVKYLRMSMKSYERHYKEKYGDTVPAEDVLGVCR